MRALVWQAPHRFEILDVPIPVAAPGEVLVAVRRAGICGSDVSAYQGKMGTARPGAIRGHEFAGVVHASSHPQWPVGARVAVNPVITCGSCRACTAGRSTACPSLQILGVHRPGAFAELVAVPVAGLHLVPDHLWWVAAASVEPLAQARHDVRRATELAPAGRCLVIGAGSIGLGIVHALRAAGAEAITAVDPDPDRRRAARAAGATLTLDSTSPAVAASFDTVFDVVGAPETRAAAVALTRPGGTVIAVGLGADSSSVPWFDVIRREITLRGSNAFTADDFRVALTWLADRTVPPPGPHRVVSLEDAPAVFADLANDPVPRKAFLDPGRTPPAPQPGTNNSLSLT